MPELNAEPKPAAAPAITVVDQGPSALELETRRIKTINNIAQVNKIDRSIAEMWINSGTPIDKVSDDLISLLQERGKSNPDSVAKLGLTSKETERFSMARAIMAAATNNWTSAPFEAECSRSVAQKMGKAPDPKTFLVPYEVLTRGNSYKRDLTVATAGAGGYLVATDNVGFVEMVRNRSVCRQLGARVLSGLTSSVTIPRQSVAGTAYWLTNEGTAITEAQQTFVQIAMTPKTVGAYTEISRQLLIQSSPSAEGIVMDDLAQVVALATDLAGLEGPGSGGAPTGISATAGIGSVSGTSLAAAGVIEFQTDVAGANVIPMAPGYVTTPAVAAGLMIKPELPTTGTTRLWKGNIYNGSLFDIPAMTTNQVTAATMIFGDWSELIIGEFGVLEVETNPYANFAAGIIGVRAIYSMDIAVRRPFAFSRATTITA